METTEPERISSQEEDLPSTSEFPGVEDFTPLSPATLRARSNQNLARSLQLEESECGDASSGLKEGRDAETVPVEFLTGQPPSSQVEDRPTMDTTSGHKSHEDSPPQSPLFPRLRLTVVCTGEGKENLCVRVSAASPSDDYSLAWTKIT